MPRESSARQRRATTATTPARTAKRTTAGAVPKKATAAKTPAAKKATATHPAPRAARTAKTPPVVEPAVTPAVARRMVFIDVENTSGEADLLRVLDHLKVDRKAQPTEVVAVGNWRTIGAKIARMLAAAGVHLVHSAPAVGVRDWSDLWIAVSAGRWLGTARPGDRLEVVSDDRAFDAVADAAANCGVAFDRLSYRTLHGAVELTPELPPSRSRRRRASRRRAAERNHQGPTADVAPPPSGPPVAATPTTTEEEHDAAAHAASQEQVRVALARLSLGDVRRWISLDALANMLRSEGFTRPPGSPRLITRLRRMRDVEVSPNGMVRLAPHAAPPSLEPPSAGDAPAEAASEPVDAAIPAPPKPSRRPRGGRRRSTAKATAAPADPDSTPKLLGLEPTEPPYSGVT